LIDANIDPIDKVKVSNFLEGLEIKFDSSNNIWLNGKDISMEIRTKKISSKVSTISALPKIREKMVKIQREIAEGNDCILEGRDIGTIVFPDADFKFFLVADKKIRAKRRMMDFKNLGESAEISEVLADLEKRDAFDSTRIHSPLKRATDAIKIDTSHITIDKQIDKIVNLINKK